MKDVSHVSKMHETNDYKKFKFIKGNRTIDERHVRLLVRRFSENGNFTQIIPVLVNENMEVFDGQHRIKALQRLGWPVFYVIQTGLTIASVIALNTGHKNWTWRDYASSYADQGKRAYRTFLNLCDEYNLRFSSVLYMTAGSTDGRVNTSFRDGELEIEDSTKVSKLVAQLADVVVETQLENRSLCIAFRNIATIPGYDHVKMLNQVATHKHLLMNCYSTHDYEEVMHEIYKYSKA